MNKGNFTSKDLAYFFFHGLCLALSTFVMLFIIIAYDSEPGAIVVTFTFFQFFFIKLCQRPIRPLLNAPNQKHMKPKNIITCFVIFNLMIVATCIYFVLQEFKEIDSNIPFVFSSIGQIVFWVAGVLCIWILIFQQLTDGVKDFFKTYFCFLKQRVSIYFLYRIFMFVLMIAAGITIGNLINRNSLESSILGETFFRFVLDTSLESANISSFLSGDGDLVCGITSAASYFVLCELVAEMKQEDVVPSLGKRILRMFFQKDTFWLLMMTVFCIFATFLSPENLQKAGITSYTNYGLMLFLPVSRIIFIVSLISFIKHTKLIPYLITYFSMSFVEAILPTFNFWLIDIFIIAIRIIIFSMLALLINKYIEALNLSKQQLNTNPNASTTDKVATAINNATIGEIILTTVGTAFAIKELPNTIKKEAKNAIKNKFK